MTAPNAQPGPLTQRALALKDQNDTMQQAVTDALTLVASRPAEAYDLCIQTMDKCDAYFKAEAEFLEAIGAKSEQVIEAQKSASETRAQLLYATGQAAFLLNKLPEARSAFQKAMALLDELNPMRLMVRMALANLPE